MSYTPGPWMDCRTIESGKVIGWHIAASPHGSNIPLAFSGGSIQGTECASNGALIAAAPEMLAALKLVWSMFDDGRIVRNISNDGNPDWALKMLNFTRELQTIQLAISKAERAA